MTGKWSITNVFTASLCGGQESTPPFPPLSSSPSIPTILPSIRDAQTEGISWPPTILAQTCEQSIFADDRTFWIRPPHLDQWPSIARLSYQRKDADCNDESLDERMTPFLHSEMGNTETAFVNNSESFIQSQGRVTKYDYIIYMCRMTSKIEYYIGSGGCWVRRRPKRRLMVIRSRE